MIIDNTHDSYNPEECVFFYKATPGKKYRLGSEKYWLYSEENYDSEDSDDQSFNGMAGMSKREKERAASIHVNKVYPDTDSSFTPRATGHYAGVYRSNTVTNEDRKNQD
jgi:hypothetical protein